MGKMHVLKLNCYYENFKHIEDEICHQVGVFSKNLFMIMW
jgi:hypothetical protein